MSVSSFGTGVSNTINGNVTVTTGNLFINTASGAECASLLLSLSLSLSSSLISFLVVQMP
jgi:hypothetical protein